MLKNNSTNKSNDKEKSNDKKRLNNIAQIKIIIIGKTGSGKTSFVNRWVNNTFSEIYKSTIISEYSSKTIKYKNNIYKINLWDIAGQDHFASLIKAFCKDAKGCITMSDIMVPSSLTDAVNWKKNLDENQTLPDGSNIPNILIQNKIDLINEEDINKYNIKEFSENNNFDAWFNTSAKTGENISECMDKLLEIIINKINEFDLSEINANRNNSIALDTDKYGEKDKNKNNKKGCC